MLKNCVRMIASLKNLGNTVEFNSYCHHFFPKLIKFMVFKHLWKPIFYFLSFSLHFSNVASFPKTVSKMFNKKLIQMFSCATTNVIVSPAFLVVNCSGRKKTEQLFQREQFQECILSTVHSDIFFFSIWYANAPS